MSLLDACFFTFLKIINTDSGLTPVEDDQIINNDQTHVETEQNQLDEQPKQPKTEEEHDEIANNTGHSAEEISERKTDTEPETVEEPEVKNDAEKQAAVVQGQQQNPSDPEDGITGPLLSEQLLAEGDPKNEKTDEPNDDFISER